jgi:hypothetical protein
VKAQQWPFCRICTRDLVDGQCVKCDAAVTTPRMVGAAEKAFRIVERHPGIEMHDVAEMLGDTSDQATMNLSALLYRLVRRGALRGEGGRMERSYFAADESKLPAERGVKVVERRRKKKAKAEGRKRNKTWDWKALRDKRRSSGLCYDCGSSLRDLEDWDRARCPECCERNAEKMRRYRATREGAKRARASSARCYERNADKYRAKDREVYLAKKLAGICIFCTEKAGEAGYCDSHYERRLESSRSYQRRLKQKALKKGLCTKCGQVKPDRGYQRCKKCRDLVAKMNRARKRRIGQ